LALESCEVSAPMLENAIHHVIKGSPLLTLLFSGFLSSYSYKCNNQEWCLGLSHWVVTNIISRKCLGQPILKYASLGEHLGENATESTDLVKDFDSNEYRAE